MFIIETGGGGGDIQDVFGLCNRCLDAAGVRVTLGRDERSVRILVPDPRVLDNGFHDATIIDMGTWQSQRCQRTTSPYFGASGRSEHDMDAE